MFVYVCVCAPMSCGMSFAALPLSSVSCVCLCVCQSLRSVLLHSLVTCSVSFGQKMENLIIDGRLAYSQDTVLRTGVADTCQTQYGQLATPNA